MSLSGTDRQEPASAPAPAPPPTPAALEGTAGLSPAELVMEYLSVADAMARRLWRPGHDRDDLRQVARLGLLHAAVRYRADMGDRFVLYALATISGELKHYLRDQSWVVRPPAPPPGPPAQGQLGPPGPGPDARARPHLRRARHGARSALRVDQRGPRRRCRPRPRRPGAVRLQLRPGRSAGTFVPSFRDPGFELAEQLLDLGDTLRGLSEADRRLLRLRFAHEMTQSEIAAELGVSQMQVSRLLRTVLSRYTTVLARLRRRMQD